MVQFKLNTGTEIVNLPSFPGSEVKIKTSMTVGEQRQLSKKYPNLANEQMTSDAFDASVDMIVAMIVEWNFTDENDQPLPVEAKYIDQLPTEDFKVLSEAVSKHIVGEQKKNG